VLRVVHDILPDPALAAQEVKVEGVKRREVPIKAFEVGGKVIPVGDLTDPALAGQKIDLGDGRIVKIPPGGAEVDGKAVLQVPGSTEAEERDVTIRVSGEMASAIEAAMNVGRWFLAVSYPDPHSPSGQRLLHCWQTHGYPREELVRALEHIKADVAAKETNPPDVRQRAAEPVRVVHAGETKDDLTWK